MKKKILIALLFCGYWVFGQNPASQLQQNTINTAMPNLSPQTPTTASLGKYGEVQVNESTGTISPSIPLLDFYTGINNLPISLQYNGNAVKVAQDPAWVGINWNLNAGGVVTRIVKDRADEKTPTSDRRYRSKEYLDGLSGANTILGNGLPANGTEWFLALQEIGSTNSGGSNSVDSEVDIFNFNFMGYSGSFFLDEDNVGHLVKYDKEMKISLIYDTSGGNESVIIIYDPQGNKYTFGGDNASESSRSYVSGGISTGAEIFNPFNQNAFYLIKVEYLNGGILNFEYETVLNNNLQAGQNSIQESLNVFQSGGSNCNVEPPTVIVKVIQNCVKLKKIYSNKTDQYIEFESETLAPERHGITKLNNVYLKSTNPSSVTEFLKRISFDYTFSDVENNVDQVNKFFLTGVNFINASNVLDNKYELEYENIAGLPKNRSFAQDLLGYYNGQNTNTTMLPKGALSVIDQYCPTLANREASLYYSQFGSLKKIKYPTGGSSSFIYELPYGGKRPVFESTLKNIAVFYNVDGNSTPHSLAAGSTTNHYNNGPITFYDSDVLRINSSSTSAFTVNSNITVPFTVTTNAQGNYSHSVNWYFKITNTTTNQSTILTNYVIQQLETLQIFGNVLSQHSSFVLSPGAYTYEFWIEANCADTHNCSGNSMALNNSFRSRLTFSLPSGEEDYYLPGLRIKEIITTTSSSPTANVPFQKTVYKYRSLGDVKANNNKEYYKFNPVFINVTRKQNPADALGSLGPYTNSINLVANNVNSPFNNESGVFNYPFVTVSYGLNDFENGGKELRYHTSSGVQAYYYAATANPVYMLNTESFDATEYEYSKFVNTGDNGTFLKSVLSEETVFDKNFNFLKKTSYDYSYETDGFAMNNVKSFLYCPNLSQGTVYYLYKTNSYKFKQTVTTSIDLFKMNAVDDPEEVTTIVTKGYDPDKVSLPNSISTTTSQGISKQTKLYYPSDIASIGNVSGEDVTFLTQMQNNHNIAEVVKTESYANSFLIDTKQIFYKNFGGKILPHVIQSKKGETSDPSVLEDRVFIKEYNSVGKPTIVRLANGSYTEYVYNSKQQVVLKIENSQYIGENDARIKPIDVIIDYRCKYQNELPKSMVTTYNYDPVTNNLMSIVDPKCDIIYYEYDDFNRLKLVKDRNGNILSENEYRYKP